MQQPSAKLECHSLPKSAAEAGASVVIARAARQEGMLAGASPS